MLGLAREQEGVGLGQEERQVLLAPLGLRACHLGGLLGAQQRARVLRQGRQPLAVLFCALLCALRVPGTELGMLAGAHVFLLARFSTQPLAVVIIQAN